LEHAARAVGAGVVPAVAGVDGDDAHALLALDRGDGAEPGVQRGPAARLDDVDDDAERLVVLAGEREHAEAGRVGEREHEPPAVGAPEPSARAGRGGATPVSASAKTMMWWANLMSVCWPSMAKGGGPMPPPHVGQCASAPGQSERLRATNWACPSRNTSSAACF